MGIQDFIKRNAQAALVASGLAAAPVQGAHAEDNRILLADNGGKKDTNVATDATAPLMDAAAPQGDMRWLDDAAKGTAPEDIAVVPPGKEAKPAWVQPASRPEMAKPPASAHELSRKMVEEEHPEVKNHAAEIPRHPVARQPHKVPDKDPLADLNKKLGPDVAGNLDKAVQEFLATQPERPLSTKAQLRAEVDQTLQNYENMRNKGFAEGGPLSHEAGKKFHDTLHAMIDAIGTPEPRQQMQQALADLSPQAAEAYKHHMQQTLLELREKSDMAAHGRPLSDKEKAEARKDVKETMRALEGKGKDPHREAEDSLKKSDPTMYKYVESLIHKIEAKQDEAGKQPGEQAPAHRPQGKDGWKR